MPRPEELSIVDKARHLRRVPILSEASTDALADLAALTTVEEPSEGKTLFEAGSPADAFYFIVDGAVSNLREGAEIVSAGPGEAVGVLAVLDGRSRAVTARTDEPSVLLRIGAEDFRELLEQHHTLAKGVIRHLASEVRASLDGQPYRTRSREVTE